jgi:5'-3' exonuclease
MSEPLYLVDSSVYIFRSYFALEPRWFCRDGMPTEAVYGFAAFLIRLLSAERPGYIVAAFDESLETGFRHRLYPAYKANRALPDEALAFQLRACRQVAEVLGIATCASSEYEADDLLASLARRGRDRHRIEILSRDKDLAQLLIGDARLQDYGYGTPLDRAGFIKTRGMAPEWVPDYLALVGDSSDNIPGVPGVGAKTATALLAALGPLDQWLDDPGAAASVAVRGARGLPAKLDQYREQIQLALKLTRLVDDAAQIPEPGRTRRRPPDMAAVRDLFGELGIGGLVARVGRWQEAG